MIAGRLPLHEELLLFGLHETKGTVACSNVEIAMAGGILAELLISGRIELDLDGQALVFVRSRRPLGDAVIDGVLSVIAGEPDPSTLTRWVSRVAMAPMLVQRTAESLCARGVLREEERRRHVFRRAKVWPRLDRTAERTIVRRVRRAATTDAPDVDERAIELVVLAHRTDLLRGVLGRAERRANAARLRALCASSTVGDAVREIVSARSIVPYAVGGLVGTICFP